MRKYKCGEGIAEESTSVRIFEGGSNAVTKKENRSSSVESIWGTTYSVGDPVEVFCDHNENEERVRDWLKGVVVQADEKMVAVQFVEDVYLTGGWMVPDRVLWCRHDSAQIRAAQKHSSRRTRIRRK
jgi:exosome complex RNA-binding protein Rrp42 (RNase PH superfamily)